MIKLINVSKQYNNNLVIDHMNLNISEGELFVIIGPSGSGKTTLLKMINKMVKPTEGEIYVDNANIENAKGEVLRRKIGYVIQNIGLLPHMNVEENISIVPALLKMNKKKIKKLAIQMIGLVGLDPEIYLNKYPYQLSGGQAQRVGIARALAADGPIMLMDEPFGSLDPITRSHLQNQISKIHKTLGKTIVFVTHDIDEAIKIGSRIAIIKDGRLIQIDTPQNILSKPKNQFVTSFLGSDRALKKLSKLYVKDYIRKARWISYKEKNLVKSLAAEKYVWVADKNGILKGWIDFNDLSDENEYKSYIEVDYKIFASNKEETLKDAISKMVWQSVKILPVCDEEGKILGEIVLSDIIMKT